MRVLVLGGSGQLGRELCRVLPKFADLDAPRSCDLSLTNEQAIREAIRRLRPAVIVNAAAFTDVDEAECRPEIAMAVNAYGVVTLAEIASRHRIALVHLSSDYVFSGGKHGSYVEEDATGPLNVYGRSKLAAETALLAMRAPAMILRTSWLFSASGPCFVTNLLRRARRSGLVRVFDQVGSPTPCRGLAEAIGQVLSGAASDAYGQFTEKRGIYHVAGSGSCSREQLARAVLTLTGLTSVRIERAQSIDSGAQRPVNSALNCDRAATVLGVRLPPWEESLARELS